jgi:hypothetical protein
MSPEAEESTRIEDVIDEATIIGRLNRKRILQTQSRRAGRKIGLDFSYHEDWVDHETINKIPTIGEELVMNMIDEAIRSIQCDFLVPPDQHPQ